MWAAGPMARAGAVVERAAAELEAEGGAAAIERRVVEPTQAVAFVVHDGGLDGGIGPARG